MTAEEFREIGQRIWGYGWQTRMSDYFDINPRTIGRMTSGQVPVPEEVMRQLRDMARFPEPPEEHSARKVACVEAVRPHLRKIVVEAERAGWTEREIMTAFAILAYESTQKPQDGNS